MRIVIDLQGCQTYARFRGIGRYSLALAQELARQAGDDEVWIALNGLLADTVEPLRAAFDGLVPQERIVVWRPPRRASPNDRLNPWRWEAAERIREAFLASLRPDIVHVSSLFEGERYKIDAATSIGLQEPGLPTAVTLYDLIPLIYPELYLNESTYASWYRRKLESLRRADHFLAISEWSRREGVERLALPEERVTNISAAADPIFRPGGVTASEEGALRERLGVSRSFLLYTGGIDPRKNVGSLIAAYARLRAALRAAHQLVIVGWLDDTARTALKTLALRHGLAEDELVCTGYVPDADLVVLYRLCVAFVFPSLHEGFGLPVLEAMRCGTAVLAAEAASLPELIGRKDALFNPSDLDGLTAKLEAVMTDPAFRTALQRHGPAQAAGFSWEISARRAREAFAELHARRVVGSTRAISLPNPPNPPSRLRLAYAASWEGREPAFLDALAKDYEIELIVDAGEADDAWAESDYPLRSAAWFDRNAWRYDRILYRFGSRGKDQEYLFPLLEHHAGTVILHDFFLGLPTQGAAAAGYRSHGYVALRGPSGVTSSVYPSNLAVLQQANGLLSDSEIPRDLADRWYGPDRHPAWTMIPAMPLAEKAAAYRVAIETLARETDSALLGRLRRSLVAMAGEPAPADWVSVAQALAENHPPSRRQRQFLVDVSELVQKDLRTGVQRVVRSLLHELLDHPPAGWRVEPVYAVKEGYRYARRFTCGFLGVPPVEQADELVEACPGDLFFGLDLSTPIAIHLDGWFAKMRQQGVAIFFLVYDLLAVIEPAWFLNDSEFFPRWLRMITELGDGVLCISQSVADDLRRWMESHPPLRERPLRVGSFHLGSDIAASRPSRGLPADFDRSLSALKDRTTVLMVGTLEPRKGYAQTLAAFETLWEKGSEAALVIVGRPGWKVEALLERLKNHSEMGRRLFWLPRASDETLLALYGSAAGLLFSSEGEGFGLPLIEAAQHRLPILARDLPVFREVAGDHAAYFSGTSPEALVEALEAWLAALAVGRAPRSQTMPFITWAESYRRMLRFLLPS